MFILGLFYAYLAVIVYLRIFETVEGRYFFIICWLV